MMGVLLEPIVNLPFFGSDAESADDNTTPLPSAALLAWLVLVVKSDSESAAASLAVSSEPGLNRQN